jgi:hypothetical protein
MTSSRIITWLLAALILIPIQASAASRGLELELKSSDKPNAAPAGSVQLYQASYALVIGIDRYTNGWPALRNAVNDARAVATKLKDHGFDVTLRENLGADDFRRTLREFFARTGRDPEARLLLWYAGHGHTVDGEGFLVPADAPRGNDPDFLVDALPLRDFGSLVRLAKSKHVLSIFDACFAGTVFEARGGVPTAAITSKTTKPVRQFITSGDAGQLVRDDGSFREYFLRALSGDEKADFNSDGYVTGEELGLFLSQRMSALTQASQTPKSGKLHDVRFNQGDFVFALEQATTNQQSVVADKEALFWSTIKDSKRASDFEAYLSQYWNGTFSSLARIRLNELKGTKVAAVTTVPKVPVAIEEMNASYVAIKTANLRSEPSTSSRIVGSLRKGKDVVVTGRVKGRNWYRLNDGSFVFGSLIILVDPVEAAEQREWDAIKDSKHATDFEEFLAKYPRGKYSDFASKLVFALQLEQQVAAKPISKPNALPDTRTSSEKVNPAKTNDKPPGGVVVARLTNPDPSSIGLLDQTNGGFGPHIWRGSDRGRIETMLPLLPMGSVSPIMQSLARRLLLSASNVPKGPAIAPSFLGLRVERLSAGGLTNETNQLLRLVPARINDPAFTKAEMEGLLLGGDRASFCVRIEGLVAEDANPYWLKGLGFCKALEGELEDVDMAVSILRDQRGINDKAFFTLARALTGDEDALVRSLIKPTPLQLAMLRAAQQPLPADAVPGASPGILRAEATMANADIWLRLAASEKAEAVGALSTELLSQIYAGIQFNEYELQNWEEQIGKMPGARLNALLFQVATVEVDVQNRVRVLQRAWRRSQGEGGLGAMARVTHDLTKSIEPADDLVWATVDITRSLLMSGDVKSARRWFDHVRDLALSTAAPRDLIGMASRAVLDLWPMMQITDIQRELGWSHQAIEVWVASQSRNQGHAASKEKITLLVNLLDVLGYKSPFAIEKKVGINSSSQKSHEKIDGISNRLKYAAKNHLFGETVLAGLISLGSSGPGFSSLSTLRMVIRAFNTIGLVAEARAIALEALLARGF